MLSTKQQVYNALCTVLSNTQYELFTDSSKTLPAISYIEERNMDDKVGDTLGYSRISYRIKLWANLVSDIELYAPQIDTKMRNIGFKRTNTSETTINNIIVKEFVYQCYAIENFNE